MSDTIVLAQLFSKILSGSPVIYNLTLTNADTEYAQVLPAKTIKYALQCRTANDVKLSFVSGESGSKFITIHSGKSFSQVLVQDSLPTLYLQSGTAGVVVEIIVWAQ